MLTGFYESSRPSLKDSFLYISVLFLVKGSVFCGKRKRNTGLLFLIKVGVRYGICFVAVFIVEK